MRNLYNAPCGGRELRIVAFWWVRSGMWHSPSGKAASSRARRHGEILPTVTPPRRECYAGFMAGPARARITTPGPSRGRAFCFLRSSRCIAVHRLERGGQHTQTPEPRASRSTHHIPGGRDRSDRRGRGMAAKKGPSYQMGREHRDKIKNSNILNALIEHAEGVRDMSPSQVTAGLGLLDRIMPRLKPTDEDGDSTNKVTLMVRIGGD